MKITSEMFVDRAKKVHGERYDYSRTEYKREDEKVIIECKIHGVFLQRAGEHIRGKGCRKCSDEKCSTRLSISGDEFVAMAVKVHGQKYGYDDTVYGGCRSMISIRCNVDGHGVFVQRANNHLSGIGCPRCCRSKGENSIERWLKEKEIEFVREFNFGKMCRGESGHPLRFDFYIPSMRTVIEFDGAQHTKAYRWFGGSEKLEATKKRDAIKNLWCTKNEVRMIRVSHSDIDRISEILERELAP